MASIVPDPSLPSQVTNHPWVYAKTPNDNFLISNKEGDKKESDNTSKESSHASSSERRISIGKWLIYNDCVRALPKTGMTNHDFAWHCIKKLVENNHSSVIGVFSAKASTAWGNKYENKPGSSHGVICCYTRDYTDKVLAKQAADAIRGAYLYPRDLLYKTDEDTYAKKYFHLGSSFVSIYKHTIKNEMYERHHEDPLKWNIVQVLNS